MSLSAQDLNFLLLLARTKSLSRAARQVGVEQSTLSRQLTALEDRLGQRLFARHRFGLVPSSYVNDLIPWAEKLEIMVRMANHLGKKGEKDVEGEVHVFCLSAIADRMIASHAPEFLAQFPRLRLRVTSANDHLNLDQLQFDLAIKIGERPKGDVVSVKIMESPLKFFGSPELLTASGQVPAEDLEIICHEREVEFLRKHLPQLKKHQFRLISDRLATCLKAAERGAGTVVIPEIFGAYLRTLSPLEVQGWEGPSLKIFLASPRVVRKLPSVEVTWNWIISLFREGSVELNEPQTHHNKRVPRGSK
jgi:DNA-binding transcriptional LysR family regulator